MVREVGATVFSFKSDDVVGMILQFAREHRVEHIVIGSSARKLSWGDRLRGKSTLLEQLTLANRDLKIVVTQRTPDQSRSQSLFYGRMRYRNGFYSKNDYGAGSTLCSW